MRTPEPDTRSEWRKKKDEEIAEEVEREMLPIPELAPGETIKSFSEIQKELSSRPNAIWGVVENGVVRPMDASIRLPEGAEVVIVQT
jgi:hypothetical protein